MQEKRDLLQKKKKNHRNSKRDLQKRHMQEKRDLLQKKEDFLLGAAGVRVEDVSHLDLNLWV